MRVARRFLGDVLVSELEWHGMMPVVVEPVGCGRSGAERGKVIQGVVKACHCERRKRKSRAVSSLWRLKRAGSRYDMAKDGEMRIWRHSSKGLVA